MISETINNILGSVCDVTMSRKQPEIKVIYPDASPLAMLLTDAMIRRSTGKRVVETNSEEKEYTGKQLFGGILSTKTDTSVELTLRLNPDAMDYALTMLVAKNLTEEEKRAIRMETDSMEIVDLLSPRAQAAEAPGQALDGDSSADVPSAEREAATQSGEQEKQIEVGKIPDKELRDILTDFAWRAVRSDQASFSDLIEDALNEINHRAGVIEEESIQFIQEDTILLDKLSILICGAMQVKNKKITELKTFASNVAHYLTNGSTDDERVFVVTTRDLADALFSVQHDFAKDPARTLDAEILIRKNKRIDEARSASRADDKTDEADKTDENAADQEVEPGLLNDIDMEGEDHAE